MKTALKKAMMVSISEVLETMFFMSLEFDKQATLESCGIIDEGRSVVCHLGFKGVFSGYFLLFIPDNILREMTESFMGQDKETITRQHNEGTIKEMLNMMAGSTFSIYDKQAEFQLDIPMLVDVKSINDPIVASEGEEITVITETIEGYIALKIIIQSQGVGKK